MSEYNKHMDEVATGAKLRQDYVALRMNNRKSIVFHTDCSNGSAPWFVRQVMNYTTIKVSTSELDYNSNQSLTIQPFP